MKGNTHHSKHLTSKMVLNKVTEIEIKIYLLLGLFAIRFLMWPWVLELGKIVGKKTQGSWFSTTYNMTCQNTSIFGACTVIDEHVLGFPLLSFVEQHFSVFLLRWACVRSYTGWLSIIDSDQISARIFQAASNFLTSSSESIVLFEVSK